MPVHVPLDEGGVVREHPLRARGDGVEHWLGLKSEPETGDRKRRKCCNLTTIEICGKSHRLRMSSVRAMRFAQRSPNDLAKKDEEVHRGEDQAESSDDRVPRSEHSWVPGLNIMFGDEAAT